MSPIFNKPRFNETQDKITRWVHSPITVEHSGIHVSIAESGKVTLSKVASDRSDSDEVEYDEIEVPASVIFKIAFLLKSTRREVEYIAVEKSEKKEAIQEKKVSEPA